MPAPPPFLDRGGKAAYLESKGYGDASEVSDDSWAFLDQTNFHYFLGYARNYRALARAGKVPSDSRIDRVVEIVRLDQQLSSVLYFGLKTFEWRLRSAVVSGHCKFYPPSGCFLNDDHFHSTSHAQERVSKQIRFQTLRSREPFLVQYFEEELRELGLPADSDFAALSPSTQTRLLQELPIWAMVDNWSLGLLVRFTVLSRAPNDADPRLLKLVADRFGVSAQVVATQLDSLLALRNLVAHHSRLWMRPSTYTPKFPPLYEAERRHCDLKSTHAVILTLATFLQADGTSKHFLREINELVSSDSSFSLGIKRPLILK